MDVKAQLRILILHRGRCGWFEAADPDLRRDWIRDEIRLPCIVQP